LTVPETALVAVSVGRPSFRPLLTVLRDILQVVMHLVKFEEC
jgi:hypothetical protein